MIDYIKKPKLEADIILLDNYIHPQENEFTERLKVNLISEEYCNQLLENYERFDQEKEKLECIKKSIEANQYQMSDIYDIVAGLCEKIKMDIPKIYIYDGDDYDITAEGLDYHWLEISNKLIEESSKNELRFMIARELCHIKFDHIKKRIVCKEFAKNVEVASRIVTIPGCKSAGDQAYSIYLDRIKLIAAKWNRIAEYTADRCAVVICDWDVKSAVTAILKQTLNGEKLVNKMNISSYLKQADDIIDLTTVAAEYTRMTGFIPCGHFRVKEMISFVSTENIRNIRI